MTIQLEAHELGKDKGFTGGRVAIKKATPDVPPSPGGVTENHAISAPVQEVTAYDVHPQGRGFGG